MPTIVGILTFVSRINFIPLRVEHEKSLSPRAGIRKQKEHIVLIIFISYKQNFIVGAQKSFHMYVLVETYEN